MFVSASLPLMGLSWQWAVPAHVVAHKAEPST